MSRCVVCNHAGLFDIDRRILDGDTCTSIALDFNIPSHTVRSHKKKHITKRIAEEARAYKMLSAVDDYALVANLDGTSLENNIARSLVFIKAEAIKCYERAMLTDNLNFALRALKEGRDTIDSILKARNIFDPKNEKRDWNKVMQTIMKVLDDFPEVKQRISDELEND